MVAIKAYSKILLAFGFALNLSATALAEASTPTASATSLTKVSRSYGKHFKNASQRGLNRASTKKASQEITAGNSNVIMQTGQTLMMMMILSGVDLVRQSVTQSKLKNQPIDQKTLLEKSAEAAEYILNDGHIWASLASAGAVGKAAKKPLQIFDQMVDSSTSRPILKDLLKSGIATFITFMGWEMGNQLYTEATEMLECDCEYERAQNLMPLLINSLRNGLIPPDEQSQKDWELLQKIFGNMMKILIHDDDLRNLWLYNTWRTRIATGEFVTMVSSMATASAIGTTLFPGAGTLGGLMFGVVGGTVALYIPEEKKDEITESIQDIRSKFWLAGDDRGPFFDHKKNVLSLLMNCIPQQTDCPPLLKFNFQSKAVENMASISFEKIFRYESRLQSYSTMKDTAEKSGNTEYTKAYTNKINLIQKQYRETLQDLKAMYGKELQETDALAQQYNLKSLMTDANLKRYPQLKQYADYRAKVAKINSFLNDFANSGLQDMGHESRDYMSTAYSLYFSGFKEQELLKSLEE
ncbi:MAG: hypothetical protein JSU04_08370 [Bdellovibrionales bacterium]|nr:hypothetical protein [Bdellovibrionales bacterium]